MKSVGFEAHAAQVFRAHLFLQWVLRRIQFAVHREPSVGSRLRNQIHDDGVGDQRAAAPVLGDEAEEPVLNLVPLTRSGGGK